MKRTTKANDGQAAKAASEARKMDAGAKRPRLALSCICVVYLLLAGLFNWVSPLVVSGPHAVAANPDEQIHIAYIGELASGHLPVFTPGGGDYEAHQPPLYYVLEAPLYMMTRSMSPDDQAKALRLLSTLIGLAFICVVYAGACDLLPGETTTALSAAAFVALLPMNVSLCASVSNDCLTNLIVALGLWQTGRIVINLRALKEQGDLLKQALLLGVIMGAGIWTKTSTLLLFPVAVIALSVAALKASPLRRTLIAMVTSCVTGLVIGLPWLARNTVLYGDPVAQHIFMTAFKNTAHTAQMLKAFHCTLPELFALVTGPWTFESFWGVFVSMSLFLPPTIYALLLVLSVVGTIGAIAWIIRQLPVLDVGRQAILWAYVALVALSVAALVRFNLVFFQAQGRYLYTALVPIATFFVIGLHRVEPHRYRYALIGFALGVMLLVDAASIYLVAAHFARIAPV